MVGWTGGGGGFLSLLSFKIYFIFIIVISSMLFQQIISATVNARILRTNIFLRKALQRKVAIPRSIQLF